MSKGKCCNLFSKFCQLILEENVWRSVRRICTWILGLKGLRTADHWFWSWEWELARNGGRVEAGQAIFLYVWKITDNQGFHCFLTIPEFYLWKLARSLGWLGTNWKYQECFFFPTRPRIWGWSVIIPDIWKLESVLLGCCKESSPILGLYFLPVSFSLSH